MLESGREILQLLYSEGQHFSLLEIIGVITALAYVALAAKRNKWCFLFGLISSLIYVYFTFVLKLYFDFGINLYYVLMSFYGWFAWSKSTTKETLTIHQLPRKTLLTICITGLVVSTILAFGARQFTDASLPYLDAFTTTFSVIATFMVVKKQIENWLLWIVVDLVSTGLYYSKELYLTALLFLIYTIVALFGYRSWRKQLQAQ